MCINHYANPIVILLPFFFFVVTKIETPFNPFFFFFFLSSPSHIYSLPHSDFYTLSLPNSSLFSLNNHFTTFVLQSSETILFQNKLSNLGLVVYNNPNLSTFLRFLVDQTEEKDFEIKIGKC